MLAKNIFKLFLIAIFVIGILNFAYADSGPNLGPNQAKKIAQDYLNSHNLPYTAVTPGEDAWKVKVRDIKTGAEKWIPAGDAKEDSPDFGGPGKYEWVSGYNDSWVVPVNNQNGVNVGRIYVDAENGKVLKAIIDPVSQTNDTSTSTNTTNVTTSTSQGSSGNNTWLIGGIIILIVAIGAGYFMYSRM